MISPIAQSLNSAYGVKELQEQIKQAASQPPGGLPKVSDVEKPGGLGPIGPARGPSGTSFSDMLGDLVQAVDGKSKAADAEAQKLMLGESNNIHQSMIAMQESSLAFTLLVEVRNKLVESYQELMRMPV
ncbi:MAG: flagellar hook-basal body complex protein FliE [Verrucomicrobia bacterium]|nr:MAG: flagellar hook-basal body complex protein FliE [Verrucomicrobiota bacterium]